MQVDAHKQKIMYQREGGRGEEKVGGIETKLQSFVSHRWKDGERREEGAVASDEKIPQRWGDVGNAVVLRGIRAASDWLLACVCVRNACQHALPSSLQLCSARSFKANRKQTIYLLLCFSSMRQNDEAHVFIP